MAPLIGSRLLLRATAGLRVTGGLKDRGRELNGQHCFYVLWMRSMNRNLTPEYWQWLLPVSSSASLAVTSRHPSLDVEP